ncbi:MAG: aminotransferase class III-fold pyridoxal phosphate-dependent enzyme [Rhodobacter sp.]|nr:aminotransferase class III-fold pyridoxal phosphate-dependent enzyme [Rhodobacter sp.]
MTAPNPAARSAWETDRARSLHPWTSFGPFGDQGALVIARGQGAPLWVARGQGYFGAVGGLRCSNIGPGRPEMAQAIAAQAEWLAFSNTFVDLTNDPAARLSARLASLAPCDLNRVHSTSGGSTAIDTAARMVQQDQGCLGRPARMGLVARDHSHHGPTCLSQRIGKRPGDRVEPLRQKTDGIYHPSLPDPCRAPDGMDEAAFCTCPGHPVACAAALRNTKIIKGEDLPGNAARVGARFGQRLADREPLPSAGPVRGSKLMICVENIGSKATKARLPGDLAVGKRISDACTAMGLMVRPIRHLNVMSPPL